jgi:hypothetical protein
MKVELTMTAPYFYLVIGVLYLIYALALFRE